MAARRSKSLFFLLPLALWIGMPRVDVEAAETADLERCRYLLRRIEFYTDRRRLGGSAAQMERWRQSRKQFELEYRKRRCHRFGRRLRKDR